MRTWLLKVAAVAALLVSGCNGSPEEQVSAATPEKVPIGSALEWQADGDGYILQGSDGKIFLVLEEAASHGDQTSTGVSWSTKPELQVPGSVSVFELSYRLHCPAGGQCNECRPDDPDHGDDCPPLPPPFFVGSDVGQPAVATLWEPVM